MSDQPSQTQLPLINPWDWTEQLSIFLDALFRAAILDLQPGEKPYWTAIAEVLTEREHSEWTFIGAACFWRMVDTVTENPAYMEDLLRENLLPRLELHQWNIEKSVELGVCFQHSCRRHGGAVDWVHVAGMIDNEKVEGGENGPELDEAEPAKKDEHNGFNSSWQRSPTSQQLYGSDFFAKAIGNDNSINGRVQKLSLEEIADLMALDSDNKPRIWGPWYRGPDGEDTTPEQEPNGEWVWKIPRLAEDDDSSSDWEQLWKDEMSPTDIKVEAESPFRSHVQPIKPNSASRDIKRDEHYEKYWDR
ncbi:MAG: hypothetical protein M1814_000888 [Vezdaea aestivalis]|nr:MAG: hypothetical protein M1814_000888 [Vezdaea aestivalis]